MPTGTAVSYEALGVTPYAEDQFSCRIQSFSGGGFEAVVYWRSKDLWRHNPLGLVSGRGSRVRSKAEVEAESCARASRRVRWLCREILADHLLTLTTRELKNEPGELLDRCARFVELYRKALGGRDLLYVAVPEPHPSNPDHFHVHVAIRGRVHVNVARQIWWALCGGRGMGNIHARFIRVRRGVDRAARIAGYLSKYVRKSLGASPLASGRHRYRSSRISLQARRLLIVAARNLTGAVEAVLARLRLWRSDVRIILFSDGSGFWLSCAGNLIAEPEPPF